MKKLIALFLVLVVALTACDAMAPTQAPVVEPTAVPPTAEVIVVTVEVPVEVTSAAPADPPTPMPTATLPPAPEPTEAPPTEAVPTEAAPAESAPSGGPFVVDASLGSGYFQDITYSSDKFSLRCQPKEITITAKATDPYIVDVEMYFRLEDRQGTVITEWKNTGKMQRLGDGQFTKTFSGEDIHPDLRKKLAWFDFQLIGTNEYGDAVGRTGKIVQLVTYTIDCQP